MGLGLSKGASPAGGKGGTGGWGQGSSPPPEAPNGPVTHDPDSLKGRTHEGRVAASFLVEGDAKKGEVKAELKDLILSNARHAEESLEKERIPRDLKEIPLRYYEEILKEE